MTYSTRRTLLADMARFTAALPLIDWSRDVAQQRVPRVGFMSGGEPSLISSFEDEMRRLGYSPGQEHPYRNDRRQYVGTWEPAAIGAVTAPIAVLVRTDGDVAWVGDLTQVGLADALTTWFGSLTAA